MAEGNSQEPKRRRDTSRTTILEAASAIIAEKGIDNFTISDVARRGGVNRALIYHYFQDRDNLVAHAIDHLIALHEPLVPRVTVDAVEGSTSIFIEHPEIGRLIFLLLLDRRPLGQLGKRLTEMIGAVETYKEQYTPGLTFDVTFALVILLLSQLSWSVAGDEVASLLAISREHADERFAACLKEVAQTMLTRFPPA